MKWSLFTVTEFPIVEYLHHDHFFTVTDLDVLAFRFTNAVRIIAKNA
jgi:hypothetical protein